MLPALTLSSGDLILDRRYGYAEAMLEAGDAAAARDILHSIVAQAPGWLVAHHALARAALAAGDMQGVTEAVATCLGLDPTDRLGAGLLTIRAGRGDQSGMSPAFVADLFDRYAPTFDRHLVEDLQYDAPARLIEACLRHAKRLPFAHVLDLGCGTGLAGEVIRPHARVLNGVDLSTGMLERARERGIYDGLIAGDLVSFLEAQTPSVADLIVAADVFAYLADLTPVMRAARRALGPDGVLAFTVQALDETAAGPDAVLGADMRFAHRASYIRELAATWGFQPLMFEAVSTRLDAGLPVPGWLVLLAVPAAAP